jgi:NAD(P)-dependent dehydrogenase (short-subunit alcohol dehydrogenase family)
VLELDVTSDASVNAAATQVLQTDGRIDLLVNNAGTSSRGPLEAFSIEQMAALLDLNVLGAMRVNKAFLPTMRAQRSGLIVWISSTHGRVLAGRGGLYPASNWAREGFAEALHHELRPFGIDVAILEPGAFPTPLTTTATHKALSAVDADIAAAYAALAPPANREPRPSPPPGHRPPDPQEVADAILRLVDTPAGQRPLRTVVGPVYTEGVAEYNQTYERVRTRLQEALKRPDQTITWSPPSR